MKLRDHRFLKFEAMMAVAAFVSSFIICSIIRYGLRMEVYLIVGLVGGHLLGGVLTWKVFVKEEWVGWIKLTIVQSFFSWILFWISPCSYPFEEPLEALLIGLLILRLSFFIIIPIAICCKLYREYFHNEEE